MALDGLTDTNGGTRRGMMQSLTTRGPGANVPRTGRWIPMPDIPVQPVLSAATFRKREGPAAPSVLDAGQSFYVTAGRMAIAWALDLMGVKEGDKVLVPAYHCASMVEPLSAVSAIPVFYRIGEDLSADLDDVARKIEPTTRVLMAANYFGFPQDLATLRRFCDANGLLLLEDCAHSFFGAFRGRPLGSFGDFAIASLTKFFPVRDGGCVVSGSMGPVPDRLRPQGIGRNVIAVLDSVEESVRYGRLRTLGPAVRALHYVKHPLRALSGKAGWLNEHGGASDNPAQSRSGVPGEFDAAWLDTRITRVSRAVCERASAQWIVERRRRNYQLLLEGLAGLGGCRPFLPGLPDTVVPYMFPLWIDDLSRLFPRLEDRAIPMQRFGQFLWPGVDESVCRVSAGVSRHLVQFPCHQELTTDEVETIISRVRAAVSG